MRKREREKKTTQKVPYIQEAFSEHTQKAFSVLRGARGVGVAGVGVACRAWSRVGLVVVVAMSLSLFTEHAG